MPRTRNEPTAYCRGGEIIGWSFDDEMSPSSRARFEALAERQTQYALEALELVFSKMPWGDVIEFSDGRRATIEPFVEPRWTKGATGSTELVDGSFDVKFLDGGHLEFMVTQTGWETPVRTRNPQARLEYRDLITGKRVRPGTPGSVPTGRYVMRLRPARGEPFEVVVVDSEDLDPAKDTFGVAKETYPHYRGMASKQAKKRARERRRMPTFERDAELRIPGARATFRSAAEAADRFLSRNPSLWDLGWADVGDPIEDWMDRTEVRVRGGRYRPLDETRRGREILGLFRSGRNNEGLRDLLAYIFGQAKGRRWDEVSWDKVDEIVDIFADSAQREVDRTGSTDFLVGGIPRIEWFPPGAGFGAPTPEFVESLTPRGQTYYARWEASRELYGLAESLERALRENRRCLTAPERRVVRDRIKTIKRWAERPDEMPEWACASFREPAAICDLLGIEAEARKLAQACEIGYDPAWPIHERDSEPWRPGLGIHPAAAELEAPVTEDLDLPWETAANPAVLRERLKRR